MTKVLLSNRNSVWGVIINPQSSNTYRHVLSFDTPELKDAFISKELFGGQDYKVLIEQQPETKFAQTTALNATWRINPDDYNETTANLLNKDFAIVKENGKFLYYAITSAKKIAPKTIEFTGELDIFFQYDVKEMFNDKPAKISRAMSDRFAKVNNKIVPITEIDKKHESNPIYYTEPIDQIPKENLIPSSKKEIIESDFTACIDTSYSAEKKALVNTLFNRVKWGIVFKSLSKEDQQGFYDGIKDQTLNYTLPKYGYNAAPAYHNGNSYDNAYIPYMSVLAPVGIDKETSEKYNVKSLEFRFVKSLDTLEEWKQGTELYDVGFFEHNLFSSATTLKTTFNILPFSPLNMKGVEAFMKIKFDDATGKFVVYFQLEQIQGTPRKWVDNLFIGVHTQGSYKSIYFTLTGKARENLREYKDMKIKPIPDKLYNAVLSPANKVDLTLEPKSYFAPYRNIKIGSSSNNKLELIPQLFTNNIIKFIGDYSYMTENWMYWLQPYNYYNQLISDSIVEAEQNYQFIDATNYSLPTATDAWEEFIASNKYQQNAQFLSKGVGLGLGVLGVALAPFTGGASLGVAALGLGSVALKSASDINQQIAMRSDIQSTPDKLTQNGSTALHDLQQKDFIPHITEYTLPNIDLLSIRNFFLKYGYNFNNRLMNINDVLKTRYYFNYVEIPETFENNKLQASAAIKQIINDSFANGITIWNVRDLATFKGIKNYEYENVEMSLI